jgi:hypothetical protein
MTRSARRAIRRARARKRGPISLHKHDSREAYYAAKRRAEGERETKLDRERLHTELRAEKAADRRLGRPVPGLRPTSE